MEGGRGAKGTSDGDEFEGAWRGASRHADQHGQSGVDVLEARAMEGGRGARRASDGDEKESAWRGASRHADQHEQSRMDMEVLRPRYGCLDVNHGVSRLVEKDFRRLASEHGHMRRDSKGVDSKVDLLNVR